MISSLRLQSFRAYDEAELEFDPDFNRIVGKNGVGKTSLLEAVAHLGYGNSPWSGRTVDVIKSGSDFSIIHGQGSSRQQDVKIKIKRGSRKEVYLRDKRIPRMSELLGVFPVTAVGPQEIELVKGSPSIRRKMLDTVLCQIDSVYTDNLSRFKKLILDRNSALKGVRSGEMKGGHVLIDSIDETLASSAARVMEKRGLLIKQLYTKSAEIYNEMTGGRGGELNLEYKPTVDVEGKGVSEIEEGYYTKLSARRKRDLDTGETVIGPHRDELYFGKDGEDMARFGSWGQARAASLAVLLASTEIINLKVENKATLLLDDCFAELDPENTQRFVEIAARYGQVMLASPREIDPPEGKKGALFLFDRTGMIRRNN